MLKNLLSFLENKKIIILGFGIEGQSSYNFLRRNFKNKKIYISDQRYIAQDGNNTIKRAYEDEKKALVEFNFGENYLDNLSEFDLILKTPGLSFKGMDISKIKDKIYTSIDLFLKYYNIITIGVTGTKGKSTTSTLIYEVLKKNNKDVYLLGNIEIPIFEQIENINNDSYVILELSSHQLQFMKYTTRIAILTNIFPEHLDHYNSYKEYIDCKYNIFTNVKNMKILDKDFKQNQIYGKETEAMFQKQFKYDEESICVDLDDDKYNEFIKNINLKLKGEHNLQNAIFALIVADILNLEIHKSISALEEFNGLEHRLEYITEINGVKYYDDSISTIPETSILALKTYKDTETIILGGLDRGLDYIELIEFLNNIYEKKDYLLKNILLLPDTGYIISDDIRTEYNKVKVKDVEEAVIKAIEITKNGSCILSPGAASYSFYKNFKERGDLFKSKIYEMKNKNKIIKD